ncbi:mitochondrial 54S ribosomal protein bL31m [Aspergillus undulatus]|uniref:mitochondrial 54S ribosomal protein bL31m n=1 Tax=Aspergillus undulatus TaxID=1810928 RepID=UPI003CCD3440
MSLHTTLRRTAATPSISQSTTTFICTQCRHATLLRRPKRPYTFTQLITLSDGSTFTHRTTSPLPVYRSTRDTRNSILWNPSSSKLRNVEDDEAGRLAAFRAKFGRGWDATAPAPVEEKAGKETKDSEEARKAAAKEAEEEDDNLLDLISSFGQEETQPKKKK